MLGAKMKTKQLTQLWLITIAIIALTAGPAIASLENGLVAYWAMDGNADDATGNGHSGTGSYTSGASPLGGALSFNGSSDYVNFSDAGFPTGSSDRSISVWIKTADTTAMYPSIFSYGSSPNHIEGEYKGFTLALCYPNAGQVYMGDEGGGLFSSTSTALCDGSWHNIVFTQEGNLSTFYVDGVLDNSSTTALNFNTELSTGYMGTRTSYPLASFINFTGSIDDVALWSTALTANDASSIYNAGLQKQSLAQLMGGPLGEGGETPEPATVAGFVAAFILFASRRVLKRARA